MAGSEAKDLPSIWGKIVLGNQVKEDKVAQPQPTIEIQEEQLYALVHLGTIFGAFNNYASSVIQDVFYKKLTILDVFDEYAKIFD